LRVDGGMAASDWTMQFLADILPARVERPPSIETTAWGAAYVAGLKRGVCPPPGEMMGCWRADRVFTPAMPDEERKERCQGWTNAVTQALTHV
jgi:glycerol kinase